MPETKEPLVRITMLRGEFIHPAWRERSTSFEIEKSIAERWIAHGSAVLGDADIEPETTTHELGEFPGADKFAGVGITSLAGVKALITQHGDAWPKHVKGMTKAIAAKVSEALEAMNKPTEPPAAE